MKASSPKSRSRRKKDVIIVRAEKWPREIAADYLDHRNIDIVKEECLALAHGGKEAARKFFDWVGDYVKFIDTQSSRKPVKKPETEKVTQTEEGKQIGLEALRAMKSSGYKQG
jgi:hypothetical protein